MEHVEEFKSFITVFNAPEQGQGQRHPFPVHGSRGPSVPPSPLSLCGHRGLRVLQQPPPSRWVPLHSLLALLSLPSTSAGHPRPAETRAAAVTTPDPSLAESPGNSGRWFMGLGLGVCPQLLLLDHDLPAGGPRLFFFFQCVRNEHLLDSGPGLIFHIQHGISSLRHRSREVALFSLVSEEERTGN